jgi:hypothetical protein
MPAFEFSAQKATNGIRKTAIFVPFLTQAASMSLNNNVSSGFSVLLINQGEEGHLLN